MRRKTTESDEFAKRISEAVACSLLVDTSFIIVRFPALSTQDTIAHV
jgi:hypothetical protein